MIEHTAGLNIHHEGVLYQKNADELMPPASMSKLMTLAVIFRALKLGQLTLDDEFFVSENAWRKGGGPSGTSSMFLKLNSREKLSEIIKGIIIQSGNDACIVVAEGMAGSEDAFARLMTDEARRIGLERSTFGNSTGLPHPDQLMTARELAKLATFLITEYPDYYPIFKEKRFNYKRYKFTNRNPLIYLDGGVDGLKTGYTRASGYGLVASGIQRNRRVVLVLNGLKTKRDRRSDGQKLYEWGVTSFKEFRLYDPGEEVSEARVWGGTQMFVPLVGKGPVRVLLPRFSARKAKLRATVVYEGPLKPPIRKGDQVATLRVSTSPDSTSEVPLYAATDVEQGSVFRQGFDALLHLAFGWIL
ncbi:MAG: D-alanyl-D-alanine carboxypeptidase family protein [Pseudomonadota bacterium]